MLDEVALKPSGEWNAEPECWCFVQITDGQGYWLGTEQPLELGSGDVMVLSPCHKGQFRASQLGCVTIRYFILCPELLGGFLTMAELRMLELAARNRRHAFRHFPSGHALAGLFTQSKSKTADRNDLLDRSRLLHLAAVFFTAEMPAAKRPGKSFPFARLRVQLLLHQLTQAEILRCSDTELAARCHCGLRHFKRLFSAAAGVSFRARQAELRLLEARQMLAETDAPILDVAVAVGIRHLRTFTAMFHKRFGVTPDEWRHHCRDAAANVPDHASEQGVNLVEVRDRKVTAPPSN